MKVFPHLPFTVAFIRLTVSARPGSAFTHWIIMEVGWTLWRILLHIYMVGADHSARRCDRARFRSVAMAGS